MNKPKEPRDPASLLMKHFGTMQTKGPSKFKMSERNQARLAKLLLRVEQLRGINANS